LGREREGETGGGERESEKETASKSAKGKEGVAIPSRLRINLFFKLLV